MIKKIIRRPVFVLVLVTAIIVLGIISFMDLPLDLLPDMTFPMLLVNTSYEGAGPQEVESMVTRPLEETVSTLDNLQSVSSTSVQENSTVMVAFDWGTDMDVASMELREQIDMVRGMLPDGADDPVVYQMDPDMMPIMQMGISGEMELDELTTLAEDNLVDRLERLEGVVTVNVMGGLSPEVQVEVDPRYLLSWGVSLPQVQGALAGENINLPGGRIEDYGHLYDVRITGEYDSLEEMGGVVVGYNEAGPVKLSQVADIYEDYAEEHQISRLDGETTVVLTIQQQPDANTVTVANLVHEELEQLEHEFGINFMVAMDQSEYIVDAVYDMGQNAVIGAILAVIVLYLFLGNIRLTSIVALAIPISLIGTFTMLYFQGETLNIITIGGLALGVGLMVDNAIVVLENIYRQSEAELAAADAAEIGTEQVAPAIIAGTLTTVSVFLPVVFIEGLASILFSPLSWTVVFALLASLLVAFTVIPTLSYRMLSRRQKGNRKRAKRKTPALGRLVNRLIHIYSRILSWVMRNRSITVIVCFTVLAVSLMLIPFIGTEFLPEEDSGEISAELELPAGITLEETDQLVKEIERTVNEHPEVESILTNVGGGGAFAGGFMDMENPNQASLTIGLFPLEEREQDTAETAEDLRRELEEVIPREADLSVTVMDIAGGGMDFEAPLRVEIRGDELEVLEELSEETFSLVAEVEGTREIESSIDQEHPELQISLDRRRASDLGVTTEEIASQIRVALDGQVVTQYRTGGEEIDVLLRADEDARRDISALEELPIPLSGSGMEGSQEMENMGGMDNQAYGGTVNVPLHQVATLEQEMGPQAIDREDQVRTVFVDSQIWERDLGSVASDLEDKLAQLEIPPGYSVEIGGEQAEMLGAFGSLGIALILAVILVYLVMAALFESLLHPLVIMFSLPNAITGVILALLISGYTFNIVSFIGAIVLAGIVVNNAIILVDYINQLRRKHGIPYRKAIAEAGRARLRPVLMTSFTTCLAMLPLALGLGEGTELQAPLAVVIVGGMLVSTFFTLVLVPVMYSLFDDLGQKFAGTAE
ncbi:MAG: efflux RND transporter permease subunit [Bacillota bacterium]